MKSSPETNGNAPESIPILTIKKPRIVPGADTANTLRRSLHGTVLDHAEVALWSQDAKRDLKHDEETGEISAEPPYDPSTEGDMKELRLVRDGIKRGFDRLSDLQDSASRLDHADFMPAVTMQPIPDDVNPSGVAHPGSGTTY